MMSITSEPESDEVTKNRTIANVASALTAIVRIAGSSMPLAAGRISRNVNSERSRPCPAAAVRPPGPASSM